MIPEDAINNYNVTDKLLKDYLVNHFNRLSLQHYKEHNTLLSEEAIQLAIPNQITAFYTQNKKIVKSTDKFWAEDENNFNLFKTFINDKYAPSLTPDTKFKDLMTLFNNHSGLNISCVWSNKYENLCEKLNLKFEKVINPRFATKGGNGTCHVFLKNKILSVKTNVISPVKTGVIPDLF